MVFVDKFYGGPLDGQEQAADKGGTEPRFNAETDSRYKRWPELDSEGVRSWIYTIDYERPNAATTLGVSAREQVLTFGELASLVDGARQVQMPADAPVKALLSWSGKLRSLTVDPGAAR